MAASDAGYKPDLAGGSSYTIPDKTVCHGRGECARDEDGDGFCEVHVNTMEMGWTAPSGIDVPKCGL